MSRPKQILEYMREVFPDGDPRHRFTINPENGREEYLIWLETDEGRVFQTVFIPEDEKARPTEELCQEIANQLKSKYPTADANV